MKNCKQTFLDKNPCSSTYMETVILDVICPENIKCNEHVDEKVDCSFNFNTLTECVSNSVKVTITVTNVDSNDLKHFRYDFGDNIFISSNIKNVTFFPRTGLNVRVLNTKINSFICIKSKLIDYINCIENNERTFLYTFNKTEYCLDGLTPFSLITIDVYRDSSGSVIEIVKDVKIIGDCSRPL